MKYYKIKVYDGEELVKEITNSEIREEISISQDINPTKDLTIGNVSSAEVRFGTTYSGIEVGNKLEISYSYDDENYVYLGEFYPVEKVRTKNVYSITAYDLVNEIGNKVIDDLIDNLTYPLTINELVQQLETFLNVEFVIDEDAVNLEFAVRDNFTGVNIQARTLLEYMAEVMGCNLVNKNGNLTFAPYKETGVVLDDTLLTDLDIDEFICPAIDRLELRDGATVVGTGSNTYIVRDNLLLYADEVSEISAAVQALYDSVRVYEYYPARFSTLKDDNTVNVGDIITINGKKIVVMKKSVSASGVDFESTGNADRENQINLAQEVKALRGRTNTLTRDLEHTESVLTHKVGDDEIISRINQTAEEIKIQANRIELEGDVVYKHNLTDGITTISGDNITTGTIKGANIIAGGSEYNKYGVISVYNQDDELEAQMNYNGLQMYSQDNYTGKLGNNLYSNNRKYLAVDYNSENAMGFEITKQATATESASRIMFVNNKNVLSNVPVLSPLNENNEWYVKEVSTYNGKVVVELWYNGYIDVATTTPSGNIFYGDAAIDFPFELTFIFNTQLTTGNCVSSNIIGNRILSQSATGMRARFNSSNSASGLINVNVKMLALTNYVPFDGNTAFFIDGAEVLDETQTVSYTAADSYWQGFNKRFFGSNFNMKFGLARTNSYNDSTGLKGAISVYEGKMQHIASTATRICLNDGTISFVSFTYPSTTDGHIPYINVRIRMFKDSAEPFKDITHTITPEPFKRNPYTKGITADYFDVSTYKPRFWANYPYVCEAGTATTYTTYPAGMYIATIDNLYIPNGRTSYPTNEYCYILVKPDGDVVLCNRTGPSEQQIGQNGAYLETEDYYYYTRFQPYYMNTTSQTYDPYCVMRRPKSNVATAEYHNFADRMAAMAEGGTKLSPIWLNDYIFNAYNMTATNTYKVFRYDMRTDTVSLFAEHEGQIEHTLGDFPARIGTYKYGYVVPCVHYFEENDGKCLYNSSKKLYYKRAFDFYDENGEYKHTHYTRPGDINYNGNQAQIWEDDYSFWIFSYDNANQQIKGNKYTIVSDKPDGKDEKGRTYKIVINYDGSKSVQPYHYNFAENGTSYQVWGDINSTENCKDGGILYCDDDGVNFLQYPNAVMNDRFIYSNDFEISNNRVKIITNRFDTTNYELSNEEQNVYFTNFEDVNLTEFIEDDATVYGGSVIVGENLYAGACRLKATDVDDNEVSLLILVNFNGNIECMIEPEDIEINSYPNRFVKAQLTDADLFRYLPNKFGVAGFAVKGNDISHDISYLPDFDAEILEYQMGQVNGISYSHPVYYNGGQIFAVNMPDRTHQVFKVEVDMDAVKADGLPHEKFKYTWLATNTGYCDDTLTHFSLGAYNKGWWILVKKYVEDGEYTDDIGKYNYCFDFYSNGSLSHTHRLHTLEMLNGLTDPHFTWVSGNHYYVNGNCNSSGVLNIVEYNVVAEV